MKECVCECEREREGVGSEINPSITTNEVMRVEFSTAQLAKLPLPLSLSLSRTHTASLNDIIYILNTHTSVSSCTTIAHYLWRPSICDTLEGFWVYQWSLQNTAKIFLIPAAAARCCARLGDPSTNNKCVYHVSFSNAQDECPDKRDLQFQVA